MFVVETFMLVNGWENCWHVDGKPETFATREDAEAEIKDHMETCEEAGIPCERIDFRIKEIV
jgi:hypothetical protein